MTVYWSRDDAATWPVTINVYPGGSAYSDMALLGGEDEHGFRVGLLFEKDNYKVCICGCGRIDVARAQQFKGARHTS